MPRVYVHVRPHERLDLTSHLTGSRRGQSRAAVASTFTIWVANAQAELVAGTTITTVDPEAAASVGSDLGVTQFTADDPPCRATSRRRQAVFRAATGGDGQSFRSWIQILNPLIEPYNSQTGRDPRFGRLKEPLAIKHEDLKVRVPHMGNGVRGTKVFGFRCKLSFPGKKQDLPRRRGSAQTKRTRGGAAVAMPPD